MPLYLTEAEVAKEVLGPKRVAEWKAIAPILEREGLPPIDPLFQGRFWPAVRAWLDAYNRVDRIRPPRHGREQWPEPTTPSSERQASNGAPARDNVRPFGSRAPT